MRFFGAKITRNRTLPFAGGFSNEAQTYRANVIANGGSISDSVLAIIDTNLIQPLLASGDWARLDKFHLYAGVGSAIAARTNMVSSLYYIKTINSPTWNNSTGYTGNGSTSYLDLNYNPSLGGTLLTQNSATVFYGAKVTAYDFTRSFGARNAGVKNLGIFRLSTPASDAIANDNLDLLNTNVVTNSIALFGLQRTAAIDINCKASIINTNFSYGNQISIGIPNVGLYQCARNSSGTAESFDEMKQYYMGAGNGLVNTNTVLTAINNTLTALGVS